MHLLFSVHCNFLVREGKELTGSSRLHNKDKKGQ